MTVQNNFVKPIDVSNGIEFGIYSLGDLMVNPHNNTIISEKQRLKEIIEIAKMAEQAGIDVFDVGESHQDYFVSQAQSVILSAIVQETKKIKIVSSATLVSVHDPVMLWEDFATLDLLSDSRVELVAGRASRLGAFELLGYHFKDYEELFDEKFELLQKLNHEEYVTWSGKFRASLNNAHILPRPNNGHLQIWRAVGGPAASAIAAGASGTPMVLAHLSGPATYYKKTIDTYRASAKKSGYDATSLPITTGGFFYTADTTQKAMQEYYPHIANGFKLSNGHEFPKAAFAQAIDPRNVINVGEPELIIDKLTYQHELFGMQRYMAQIDMGGVSFDNIKRNIDLIGTKILPEVKKRTRALK
ncbi:LLM class flavin-dependent oxidoreductase [Lactococcus hircilactis]|uniref:LLM class flavin-dependent oxidoreductase n=1 Tax=Lactococcus hircilactis TaxID=1494462 RepID=A0A7X2CZK8_9LACT|nr:LLM class flavin-dependent oxidoreductase [Lactococcus hircilactis]MQW38484.1 LLM class flavin-dependent oxidoreductase [Lactococcus hircilactis]